MGEYEKNAKIVRERKENNNKLASYEAKEDLLAKVKISINTTMIGALNDFEKYFGFLWDHNGEGELSDEQKVLQETWEKARESILDRGNNSISKSQYHIGRFDIKYSGNGRLRFKMGQSNGEGDTDYRDYPKGR